MAASKSGISTADLLSSSEQHFDELFEACRSGDLTRVRKLATAQNVNARDTAGRKSSPLHFAAGEKLGEIGGVQVPVSYTHLTLPTNREV